MKENDDKRPKGPFADAKYQGNIWGWKFSLYAGLFILAMGVFMYIRYKQAGVPFMQMPKQETAIDSSKTN